MSVIVLATRNKGKIAEIRELLAGFASEVRGLDAFPDLGDIPETGLTFEENSLLKARTVCQATGLIALADDSGLAVDALNGAPGVHSARYCGPALSGDTRSVDERNNAALLAALAGVAPERRNARFHCVIAASAPGGASLVARGVWEGRILDAPDGDQGFGYDPLFFDPTLGMSAARMDRATKNQRSHRGQALRALLAAWPSFRDSLRNDAADTPNQG